VPKIEGRIPEKGLGNGVANLKPHLEAKETRRRYSKFVREALDKSSQIPREVEVAIACSMVKPMSMAAWRAC